MVKLIFSLLLVFPLLAWAQSDPNDPFDQYNYLDEKFKFEIDTSVEGDKSKSADQLTDEATLLLGEERPLDARTKLLRALEKDPKNYKTHLMLAGYYLVHVGHFRLALKYVKRSEDLFIEKYGAPPYQDPLQKSEHARLLYFLAETRLNLDNYSGALETLDDFSSLYFGPWYPGSRAWVLMKLGRLDEAIKVARLGILAGAEPGRTLNILGILLSMTGNRSESLQIFNDAILHELSLGSQGQPATPLNNSGEVYREIFEEQKAESSWLKATSMPDGCEHVLPSLNLAILFIEQLKFQKAKDAMDNFERCIAQYPLRNGEEHKALVNLARGRIALHTGNTDSALTYLETALERRQWFGKIGANLEDLSAAGLSSLAQALLRSANIQSFKRDLNFWQKIASYKYIIEAKTRAWWLMRRARQILAEDLSNFEDLYVRHTDCLLEYHTLGELLKDFPQRLLEERIKKEKEADNRKGALPYYLAYLAENLLNNGDTTRGLQLINEAMGLIRTPGDDGLKLHLLLLTLKTLEVDSEPYIQVAEQIYRLAPAELRNFGYRLPITISGASRDLISELSFGPFIPSQQKNLENSLLISQTKDGQIMAQFNAATFTRKVSAKSAAALVDKLSDAAFSFEQK